ncbi:hypothetical protein D3C86_2096070 [compost metagenome]
MDDALAGEFNVGVHVTPALSPEFFDRQHFVRRLLAVTATGLLFGVGIGTNQRSQVGEQQLLGEQ